MGLTPSLSLVNRKITEKHGYVIVEYNITYFSDTTIYMTSLCHIEYLT